MRATQLIAAGALAGAASGLWAQTTPWAPPQNVLQLTASGTVDVQQDLLVMTLNTTRESADAATVQNVDVAWASTKPLPSHFHSSIRSPG